jgi:hypothetical protein
MKRTLTLSTLIMIFATAMAAFAHEGHDHIMGFFVVSCGQVLTGGLG